MSQSWRPREVNQYKVVDMWSWVREKGIRAYSAWVREKGIFNMGGREGHGWERSESFAWEGEKGIFIMGGRKGHI